MWKAPKLVLCPVFLTQTDFHIHLAQSLECDDQLVSPSSSNADHQTDYSVSHWLLATPYPTALLFPMCLFVSCRSVSHRPSLTAPGWAQANHRSSWQRSRRKKSRISRMPTFGHRSKHPMHTLQKLIDLSTLVSPTRGGFHKPSDSHVCPENSVGIDGAMDGSGDGGKCTHEHHSQSANTQTTREQHKPVSLPIQEQHLRRVYQEACSREKKLTQRAFIEFLEHTQGEKVLVPLSKEEYTDTEFLQEWFWNYGWGILRPLKTEEDLSKPISNYFINSSHNTYLSGNQLTSPSESNAYRKVRWSCVLCASGSHLG